MEHISLIDADSVAHWCSGHNTNVIDFNEPVYIEFDTMSCNDMFIGCRSFNQPVQIPQWIISCDYMFQGCTAFNQKIRIPRNVTSCIGMFDNCTALSSKIIAPGHLRNQLPPLDNISFYGYTNEPDINIIVFIRDFVFHSAMTEDEVENIHDLFSCGYCWYFAHLLQQAFPGGEVCYCYPYEHFVYVYEGVPYDITGVSDREHVREFIPERFFGEALTEYKHLPGSNYEITASEMENILKRYHADMQEDYAECTSLF